ncbi:hypothetical protein PHYC_03576 [Phycisphaerales bacterium]|nr:hypothetical protein PHYC_03576 [Phycisphaerales bacterium]
MAGIAGRAGLGLLSRAMRWIGSLVGRTPARGRDEVWLAGEDAAAEFLKKAGYRLLARNAQTPRGEADIVAESPDGKELVVIEVKARRTGLNERSDTMPPEAGVTREKLRRLRGIAFHLGRANSREARVDVIGVLFDPGGGARVRHTQRVA